MPLLRVLVLTAPMLFTGLLAVSLIHTLHQERLAIQAALGCLVSNVTLNACCHSPLGADGVRLGHAHHPDPLDGLALRIVLRRLQEAPALPSTCRR